MTDLPTVIVAPVPALPPIGFKQRLLDYLKQPGTQKGLALFVGGMSLAGLHPFAAAESIGAVLITSSLPLLLPDNTTDAIRTRDLGNAIAHAAATRTPAAIEAAAWEAAALEASK